MRLFAVDDEAAVLNELRSLLLEFDGDTEISVFTDPREALAQAACGSVDCVLLDIGMAGMNGLELAEQLQRKCPRILIVYITAYNSYATEAFELSAIDYVLKPIRRERLFKAMEKVRARIAERAPDGRGEYSILTFGRLVVMHNRHAVQWQRNKSEEIFAYLLENAGVPVHKDTLCELVWPDYDYRHALVNLQTTIYSIRKALDAHGGKAIAVDYANNHYTLMLEGASVDFVEFEKLLSRSMKSRDVAAFRRAVRMIRKGEYLEENGWMWAEYRRAAHHRKLAAANKLLAEAAGAIN